MLLKKKEKNSIIIENDYMLNLYNLIGFKKTLRLIILSHPEKFKFVHLLDLLEKWKRIREKLKEKKKEKREKAKLSSKIEQMMNFTKRRTLCERKATFRKSPSQFNEIDEKMEKNYEITNFINELICQDTKSSLNRNKKLIRNYQKPHFIAHKRFI